VASIVNPQIVIPMHGEHRHLRTHARLASDNGRQGVLAPNGTIVDLSGNKATIGGYVETGRVYLDGSQHVGSYDGVVRDRIKMALNGHVVVAVLVDDDDEVLEDAWADIRGLAETGRGGAPLVDLIEQELGEILAKVDARTAADDDKLQDIVKKTVRQVCNDQIGKKPEVTILISRVSSE
jgi:ribonuclease J